MILHIVLCFKLNYGQFEGYSNVAICNKGKIHTVRSLSEIGDLVQGGRCKCRHSSESGNLEFD